VGLRVVAGAQRAIPVAQVCGPGLREADGKFVEVLQGHCENHRVKVSLSGKLFLEEQNKIKKEGLRSA
jgi:hypothetical protein